MEFKNKKLIKNSIIETLLSVFSSTPQLNGILKSLQILDKNDINDEEVNEIIDVPKKDERAKQWCRDVSKLTGEKWNFIRIDQQLFLERHYSKFYELVKSNVKLNQR
ncbi:MAG: hypothetical protein ACP5IJ_02670 [Candidatus Nanoarchaeia archaeon]